MWVLELSCFGVQVWRLDIYHVGGCLVDYNVTFGVIE